MLRPEGHHTGPPRRCRGVTATTSGARSAAATAAELSTLDDATALAEAHDVRPPPGLANYRLPGDNSPWRIVHPEGAMLENVDLGPGPQDRPSAPGSARVGRVCSCGNKLRPDPRKPTTDVERSD